MLSTYLNMNLLILIGFIGLGLFSFISRKVKIRIGAEQELKLHYIILLVILAFTVIHPILPQNEIFSPAAKVWSAQSIKNFGEEYAAPDKGGYLSLPSLAGTSTLQADQVAAIWFMLGTLILFLGSLFIIRDLRTLFKIKRNSFPIKKIGQVHIFISDLIRVPFSYWLPGQANIVMPSSLIERRAEYKMAIVHELQHHRHQDTKWVYVLWGLRLICVINPAIHYWNRWISEIQEFACDETLVDQNKVQSQAYARCLIEVAQSAIDQKYVPVCATGLTFLIERNILKRRIEKMLTKSSTKMKRSISVTVGIVLSLVVGATAFASKGLVQDRRVNMGQAKAMAVKAQSEVGFPVVVNDLVLKQLNRYIGTPEGREFMRSSLQRMENYRGVIEGKIQEYSAPSELMAVPIIESGYQNLEQDNNMGHGAGLWMFIAPTARTYGLRVDAQVDERLNVDALSDAAMRYLKSNYLRFKDWHLAALAYNIGENRVQQAINKTGSKDAWKLIRNGYENDRDYLPRLMAAIIIMRNPESVE